MDISPFGPADQRLAYRLPPFSWETSFAFEVCKLYHKIVTGKHLVIRYRFARSLSGHIGRPHRQQSAGRVDFVSRIFP